MLQGPQHVGRAIDGLTRVGDGVGRGEEGGQARRAHLLRIGARGVEIRAAVAVDCPHALAGQRHDTLALGLLVIGVVLEQPAPPSTYADDRPAVRLGAVDDGLDARVQARHVAAAGEDADPHDSPSRRHIYRVTHRSINGPLRRCVRTPDHTPVVWINWSALDAV